MSCPRVEREFEPLIARFDLLERIGPQTRVQGVEFVQTGWNCTAKFSRRIAGASQEKWILFLSEGSRLTSDSFGDRWSRWLGERETRHLVFYKLRWIGALGEASSGTGGAP